MKYTIIYKAWIEIDLWIWFKYKFPRNQNLFIHLLKISLFVLNLRKKCFQQISNKKKTT